MAGFPEINRLAEKIGLKGIIDNHAPTEYDKDIKNSDLFMALIGARVCNPSSILSSIETIKGSTIPSVLNLDPEQINEDLFYKRFKKISPEACDGIQGEVFERVKELYDLDLKVLDFDMSFVHVEGEKNELARRGFNPANKFKPDGVKVALLHARNKAMPIFYKTFEGNVADVTGLERVKGRIAQFKGSTLVVDKSGFKGELLDYFKGNGVNTIVSGKITEKVVGIVKGLRYRTIKVSEVRMRYAKTEYDLKDCPRPLYMHIYFDPEKAERDRARRLRKQEKTRKEQAKIKELIEDNRLRKEMERQLAKELKRKGLKALVNVELDEIEFEEKVFGDPSLDGLVVIYTTRDMGPTEALIKYRQHVWIEKGFRELKQSHLLRPIYVRKENMTNVLTLISFLAYLILCLFRLEHRPFKHRSDGTLAGLLNAPCILLRKGKRLFILLSEGIAKFFGKFAGGHIPKLKLKELLYSHVLDHT